MEKAEALRRASALFAEAKTAADRGLRVIQGLYDFAARQMVTYTMDAEDWHLKAAEAATQDANKMTRKVFEMALGPGTIKPPANL